MPPLASPNVLPQFYGMGAESGGGGGPVGKVWTIGSSSTLYRVQGWGAPYFCINKLGHMAVRPRGDGTDVSEEIDVMNVVERASKESMCTPLIIRFPSILQHRLESLHAAFDRGISAQGYQGRFQGVYPVKCNPDRYIVEDIVKYGKHLRFGLEAGSKPELLMAMCVLRSYGNLEALLICNGYKDAEYISIALRARQLGLKTVIVLEQEEELKIVLHVSDVLGITPVIGIRAKLNTKHEGHWGETSGEKGKFGLTPSEICRVVSELRINERLNCLQLLHFHIGSQIPSLELVDEGVSEASHIYCELAKMGASMKHIDIGGGLGVDYNGTNSATSDASIGYTLEEYAEQVVNSIKLACAAKNVKHPMITCESGRGLVSHHSVVVFDVLSARAIPCSSAEDKGIPTVIKGVPKEMASIYEELVGHMRCGKYDCALDCAKTLKKDGTRLFKLGQLNLENRAMVDKVFDTVKCVWYEKFFDADVGKCRFRKEIVEETATYHVNLSVFKSLPDSWAIRQLFPFLPLHRLDEEPTKRAILSDLTCDSDGKVATFIGHGDHPEPSKYLRLHSLNPKKPYYIGMFLAGAYQEVLGSLHNLFGAPNVVHVKNCSGAEGFEITRKVPGQSTADVLRLMQHDPDQLLGDFKTRVAESAVEGRFRSEEVECTGILSYLSSAFGRYTYLSNNLGRNRSKRVTSVEPLLPLR